MNFLDLLLFSSVALCQITFWLFLKSIEVIFLYVFSLFLIFSETTNNKEDAAESAAAPAKNAEVKSSDNAGDGDIGKGSKIMI